MKVKTKIRLTSTILVLFSYVMGRYVNPYWLWISAVIGFNILQSAFTGFCPVETLFKATSRPKKNASL